MHAPNTRWRVSPAAWLLIAPAIAAESVSNGLRAYGLGQHLERFTVQVYGAHVSLAGAVLVLAAVAVSLTQARAAWLTLAPGNPARQRIVAGFIAALAITISVTAMASHILEAQRAKTADEGGARGRYDRAQAAYDKAAAELQSLGTPRPVSVVQAEISSAKVDMAVWRRSVQCTDISRDDTKSACQPILALYKERGAAARATELAPEVERLRQQLAGLDRPEESGASEGWVAMVWAWIMGVGVVLIATFGSVLFAVAGDDHSRVAPRDSRSASRPRGAVKGDGPEETPPPPGAEHPAPANVVPFAPINATGGRYSHDQAERDLLALLTTSGAVPEQRVLCARWQRPKPTVSRWLDDWERRGLVARQRNGRGNAVIAASAG